MSDYRPWGERQVDFTPQPPEEWHNVSTINDDWEVEMNIYGDSDRESTWRHRRPSIRGLSTEWQPGRPPSGFYAKKA